MKDLGGTIAEVMILELGKEGFLDRLSDPFWFQCLGCVLGFDWHSSGLTTTTCGALKEGLRDRQNELGIFIGGGKGRASRRTPDEIRLYSETAGTDADTLVHASRMSAKVDSSAVQDGFQVYHHTFVFTSEGSWTVIQQGMNEKTGWARRYHWLGSRTDSFVSDPHKAICSDGRGRVLNMVAGEAEPSRAASVDAGRLHPDKVFRELKLCLSNASLDMPGRHGIVRSDIHPDRLKNVFVKTYERQPEDFETLLGMRGVGGKSIRALCMVGQLLYGAAPSFRDPARFSFAHGGKDGIPYPVDRPMYDQTCAVLEKALSEAKVDRREKLSALKRMARYLDV